MMRQRQQHMQEKEANHVRLTLTGVDRELNFVSGLDVTSCICESIVTLQH